MNGETPLIYVKRNKINEIFDYCLDNGIEFSVKERTMGIDEFEVSMEVTQIKKAIQLGAFLRENRIELVGSTPTDYKAAVKKPAVKKAAEPVAGNPILKPIEVTEPKAEPAPIPTVLKAEEEKTDNPFAESASLSFDLN